MDLKNLKVAIESDNFRITIHAFQELDADKITVDELISSFENAEIIEDYLGSKPLPCCLVLSFTDKNYPVHSVWAYNENSKSATLVTVYSPNPAKWVEYKKRK